MKISDEIRVLSNKLDIDENTYNGIRDLANRIDHEMVELPKDRDGVPIHEGDKMYLDDGQMFVVNCIKFVDNDNPFFYLTDVNRAAYIPNELTHTCPDNLERIADELDKWCDGADIYGDACGVPRELVDRIRKLAKIRRPHTRGIGVWHDEDATGGKAIRELGYEINDTF